MMKKSQRDAVLISLVREMINKGSWCGETHIQKAAYFLQALLGVPLEFDFILYNSDMKENLGERLMRIESDVSQIKAKDGL